MQRLSSMATLLVLIVFSAAVEVTVANTVVTLSCRSIIHLDDLDGSCPHLSAHFCCLVRHTNNIQYSLHMQLLGCAQTGLELYCSGSIIVLYKADGLHYAKMVSVFGQEACQRLGLRIDC